eukprot:71397_1
MQKRAWVSGGIAAIALGSIFGYQYINDNWRKKHAPHIVIVGGGIMGSWSAHLLSQAIAKQQVDKYPYRVTLIDANHPIRGSWGDSRALHAAIDCDLRVKLNKLNLSEYISLQEESQSHDSNVCLLKKVGRVFVGPSASIENMHKVIQSNNIPVRFVASVNDDELQSELQGVEIRTANNGWPGFKTLYTPFGYILKANNILEFLRETLHNLAAMHSSITVYDDQKVINIDRKTKKIAIQSMFNETDITNISYDKLLVTCGPWSNQILQCLNLPLVPIIVSNEQTQDFGLLTATAYQEMPLVTFSDGGYTSSGSEYWFMVPSCSDCIDGVDEHRTIKVGYHRQGELMKNDDFQISEKGFDEFRSKLPHVDKEMSDNQSFGLNHFILNKAKTMISQRLDEIDGENVHIYMRCLYQNTPDKEFIVGYPAGFGINDKDKDDIVIACGFNGGGYQQAPMIARFCIHLLLKDLYSDFVSDCLKIEKYQPEFGGIELEFTHLFEIMQTKFDPSRDSLKKYVAC